MLNIISLDKEKDKNLLTLKKLEEKKEEYFLSRTEGERLSVQAEILNAEKILSNALETFKEVTLFDQNNIQDDTHLEIIINEYLKLLKLRLDESVKYYRDYSNELKAYSLKVEGANKELLQKIGYLYGLEDTYSWVFIESFLNNFYINNESLRLNVDNEVQQATLPIVRSDRINVSNYYINNNSSCIVGNIEGLNKFEKRLNETNSELIFSVHQINQNCTLLLELELIEEKTINFFKINFSKKSKVKSPALKSIKLYTRQNEFLELNKLTGKTDYEDLINESYGTYFLPKKINRIEIKIEQSKNYFKDGIKIYPIDINSIELKSVNFQNEGSLKSEVFSIEPGVFNIESKVSVFPESDGYELLEKLKVDDKFQDSKEGLLLSGEQNSSEYFINLKRKDELNIIPLNKNIVYDYEKHVYNLYDTPNYVPIVNEYVSDKIKIFKNKSSSRTTINKFKAFFSMNKIYIELNDVFSIGDVIVGNSSTSYEIWEENNIVKGISILSSSDKVVRDRITIDAQNNQNYVNLTSSNNVVEDTLKFELGFDNQLTKVDFIDGVEEFGNSKLYKERLPVESVTLNEIITFNLSKEIDSDKLNVCKLYKHGEVLSTGFRTLVDDLELDIVYVDENNTGYIKTSENNIFEGYEIEYMFSEGEAITNSYSFNSESSIVYFSETLSNGIYEVSFDKTNFDVSYFVSEKVEAFTYNSINEEVEINEELNGRIEIYLPILKDSVDIKDIKNFYSPIISEIKIGGS